MEKQRIPERKWVIFYNGEAVLPCKGCKKMADVTFYRIADGVCFCKRCYVDFFEKTSGKPTQ